MYENIMIRNKAIRQRFNRTLQADIDLTVPTKHISLYRRCGLRAHFKFVVKFMQYLV